MAQRSQSKTPQPPGKDHGFEIQEQADAATNELKISQDLGVVHIEQGIHSFEFDHDKTSNDKIQPIGVVDQQVLILNRAKLLLLEKQSTQL